MLKTKFLRNVNVLLLLVVLIFGIYFKDGLFYIHREGLDHENEITLGFIEFIGWDAASFYEINIPDFSFIAFIILFIPYRTLFYFGKIRRITSPRGTKYR